MDTWFLVVFILAVHLASKTGAQSTTTTPATTTTAIPLTTTSTNTSTDQTTTTYYPNTATTTTASNLTTSYPNTATTLSTAHDFPNTTTTITTSANPQVTTVPAEATTTPPTPGGSNLTTVPTEATTTSPTPGGSNLTTVPTEATTTSPTPGGSNLTTVPTEATTTSPTPGGSNLTTVPTEATTTSPTPGGSNLTTVPTDATTTHPTPGGSNLTTVPAETTPTSPTPGGSNLTTVPEDTTTTPGGSNLTTVPADATTTPSTPPTPGGSNLTTVPAEATTTPPTPGGSNLTTVPAEATTTSPTPGGSNLTTVPAEATTTSPTPGGSNLTTVPAETSPTPGGSNLTTVPTEATTTSPTPGGSNLTTVPTETTTTPSTPGGSNLTTVPADVTTTPSTPPTPGGSNITTVPAETTTTPPTPGGSNPTTIPSEATTTPPTPGGSNLTTVPVETSPTPGGSNLTTVPVEATTTPPTPGGSNLTTVPTEATTTPSTPGGSNLTTVPAETSPTPGGSNLTTVPAEATTTPPTPGGSNLTTVPTEATTTPPTPGGSNLTTVPTEATTTSPTPGGSNLTTVPTEATTTHVTPGGSNLTTVPAETTTTAMNTTTAPPPPTTTAINTTTTTTTPRPTPTTTTPRPSPTSTTPRPTPTSTPRPTPTSTTPPTTTPLVCDNGGVSLNGVCICPDEWTGETCSIENFCRAQELEGFKFPVTPIDWFAYSEQTCPKGTSGAGKPQASTRCSNKNRPPSFELPPRVLQCDQTLSDIQKNLTSPEDLEALASSTQILTSKPEELTAENVTAAAQIANTLLLSPNATESVRVAAVATVSQLLNASTPDSGEEDNATLGLTLTLDQLAVNLSLSLGTSQSQVVQPNLVVQSAQIPAVDTKGVQFTSLSGTSGSFVADRIQLNTNASTVEVENGFIADAVIYVRFPPDKAFSVRQQPANVSLGFVLYQNNRFFRSKRYRPRQATIRVLSATVQGQGQGRSVTPQHVEMLFRPTVMNGTSLFDFACVFWDYNLQDWSTAGCSKGNTSDGLLRCFCNHTTNFAALWSFRVNYEYAEALGAISVVGLSLSLLGLIITIIHHLRENFQINCCEKRDEDGDNVRDSQISLLSICFSLLAFIITFVIGVGNSSRRDAPEEVASRTNAMLDSDEYVEPDGGSCSAVAALLHFFLLATFVWNSLYGTLALWVRMKRSLPAFWTPLSVAIGWGVPAAIMAITLGATYSVDNPLGYRQEEFCWLAALDQNKQFHFGKPMFWGFLLPVGLILMYNIVLLVLILTSKKWRTFLYSFSLAVLLGLSWSLGYLVLITTGHTHLVFSILFCICTSTQGIQIFVLFTARKKSFRAAVSQSVKYVSSVHIPLKDSKYSLQRNWGKTSSEFYRDLRDLN